MQEVKVSWINSVTRSLLGKLNWQLSYILRSCLSLTSFTHCRLQIYFFSSQYLPLLIYLSPPSVLFTSSVWRDTRQFTYKLLLKCMNPCSYEDLFGFLKFFLTFSLSVSIIKYDNLIMKLRFIFLTGNHVSSSLYMIILGSL